MEAYFVHGGLPPNYRCDVVNDWSYERWLQEGEPHVALGICTLIYGIICILLYIPCCCVLLHPDLRSITAYKLLFIIAVAQIISLFINSVSAGIFFIQGIVFCNYPNINYLLGCGTMVSWSCIIFTCFILSLSRLVDIWSPSVHDAMFAGKRVMYSFVLIAIYSITFYLYANPTVFNSRQLAWIFDPLVYPDGSNFKAYANLLTVMNNEGTVGITLCLVLLFIASFVYKSARYQFKMSYSQKQLFVQSTFSTLSILVTATLYVSFGFISGGPIVNYLGLLMWEISSAGELFLFLFINKTVRARVLSMLHLRKRPVGSVGRPSNSQHPSTILA